MAKSNRKFAIGLDYGTNSVRALIVDVENGSEIASVVDPYPSGNAGVLLNPKQPLLARQNPDDYINGFYRSVSSVVRQALDVEDAEFSPDNVVGIGVDTTGSTPIPVDRNGIALGLLPQFKNEPDAQSWIWKDHTAFAEAAEITEKASHYQIKYLSQCGERYSSEWFWSKILHCKRVNPKVFEAAYSWVELADFIPALMIGNTNPDTLPRGICAAGHKAMFHTQWGGLPSAEFLGSLDPDLVRLRNHFNNETKTSDQAAGQLCEQVAAKAGLPAGIPVTVGILDCHAGAVGAGIKPGTLVKIIGTSTCDVMIHPLSEPLAPIPGLCGIVPGSVMSGMYGIEAGQSGVGDIFNWFVKNLTPEPFTKTTDIHNALAGEAEKLAPGESGLLALDWHCGNRTILVDQLLTGLILGMTVHTTAPEIYRALIEATAFGALTIINRLEEYGVKVNEVINCGGIAEKSPLTMQIYADVCNKPMKISRSPQTCAFGAAILGSVAGGYYKNVETAQQKMTGVKEKIYVPNSHAVAIYQRLYKLYHDLHDTLGRRENPNSLYHVMKELIDIRENVRICGL
ncbi:MAG: ribulokinase [Planctomycetaceae bacterium]|jgi:L-ribulokinase|nr:ribulokinase [Planctomycetaceae bacterium]